MIRLKTVPLFGTDIVGKNFYVTRQRRLNVYFEVREDHDKTSIVVFGTPGLVPLFKTTQNGPVRGFLGNGKDLYLVANNRFQSVNKDGSEAAGFNINSSSGYVSLAKNTTQVILADGINGYLYNIGTKSFSIIGGAFPNGTSSVTYVSGFFVATQPGTQKFWVSNANDGSTWGALTFASASAFSGNIVAVDSLTGNLVLFCEDHIEFWQDVGASPEPFAPIQAATTQYGIAATFSRNHMEDSIVALVINTEGIVQVAQIAGYAIKIVSTSDLDQIINSFDEVSDAVGMSYGVDSHPMYQITFPSANRSFIFDLKTRVWSEVQTGQSLIPTRHWGNQSTLYNGTTIISDFQKNQIYTMSPDVYVDAGTQIIPREVITKHVLSDFNRIRISQLYLDMEVGQKFLPGNTAEPQVMLQYSKDNGHTWSSERWHTLGGVGKYKTRVRWKRFGSTRDAVFKIRMTDSVKFAITDGAITIKEKGKAPPK